MNLDLDLGGIIAGIVAIVSLIVWSVRLESRVNSAEKTALADKATAAAMIAEVGKDHTATEAATREALAAIRARQDVDSASNRETTLALVRVQEQLKYLTSLFERHFVEGPGPRRRNAPSTE